MIETRDLSDQPFEFWAVFVILLGICFLWTWADLHAKKHKHGKYGDQ